MSRASIALITAVVFFAQGALAQEPATTPAPAAPAAPAAAEAPPTEQDWGLAGDALTVGAAGVGAVLGLVAMTATSQPDGSISPAGVVLPLLLPAGFAAGARALQPRRTLLNVALPAAGAAIGPIVGVVGYIGLAVATRSAIQNVETVGATGGAVIAVSVVTAATMLTTAGAVAVAHAIEGE